MNLETKSTFWRCKVEFKGTDPMCVTEMIFNLAT